jgi:hypothetical protein
MVVNNKIHQHKYLKKNKIKPSKYQTSASTRQVLFKRFAIRLK